MLSRHHNGTVLKCNLQAAANNPVSLNFHITQTCWLCPSITEHPGHALIAGKFSSATLYKKPVARYENAENNSCSKCMSRDFLPFTRCPACNALWLMNAGGTGQEVLGLCSYPVPYTSRHLLCILWFSRLLLHGALLMRQLNVCEPPLLGGWHCRNGSLPVQLCHALLEVWLPQTPA